MRWTRARPRQVRRRDAGLALKPGDRHHHAVLRRRDSDPPGKMLAHGLHARGDREQVRDKPAKALIRAVVEQDRAGNRCGQCEHGPAVRPRSQWGHGGRRRRRPDR